MSAGAADRAVAPVLFLDIDGVLNRTRHATHIRLDDDLVDRLKAVVEQTQCEIVLSTFWRHFQEYITYILNRHGIPASHVVGRTPGVSGASSLSNDPADAAQYANRAAEIRAWLDAHPGTTRFCILDDRACAADATLAPNFVQTATEAGLSEADAARCRVILLGTP